MFFLYHCPSLPTPIMLLKKVWDLKVNLRGTREFCTPPHRFPQSVWEIPYPAYVGSRCVFWDPAIPALPVCCLFSTLSANVLSSSLSVSCSVSASLSPPRAPEVLHPQAFLV